MCVERFEMGKWYRFVSPPPKFCGGNPGCYKNNVELFKVFGYKPWKCTGYASRFLGQVEGFTKPCEGYTIGGPHFEDSVEEVFPVDDKLYDCVTNINQPECTTYLVKWHTGSLTTFTADTPLTEYPSNAQQVWILDNPIYDKDVEKVKKDKLDKISQLEFSIKESNEQIEQLKKEIM